MKHAYLSIFLGLALLSPSAALAQAEGEVPPAGPPAAGGDAAGSEGAAAEGESAQDEEEEEERAAPASDPEPELSATEQTSGTDLGDPSVTADLEAAEDEGTRVDEDEAEDDAEEGPKLPWRNSVFLWDHAVGTTTFDRGSTLSYNPYYAMSFSFRPRWYLTDSISLRLRQDLVYELTDTDDRALNRELVVVDTRFDLVHAKVAELEGATLALGARLTVPTSKASRAYDMYFAPGLTAGVSRPFEDVLEGLTLGLDSTYSYSFAGSNVVFADDPLPQVLATPGLDRAPGDSQVGGASVTGHSWTLGLSASLVPVERMSIDLAFTWWWRQGRGLADGCVAVASAPGGETCFEDGSDSHLRLLTNFSLGVGYDVLDWLNASVTYGHLTSELNPSGTRRNPFWSPDSAVSVTASVTLDALYTELTEEDVAAADADSDTTVTAASDSGRGAQ